VNRVHDPLVMPFANVRHLGFRDKVRAARLAGFGQLSLHPHEARDTIRGGLRPQDMLEIAAADDVAMTRLDPLSNWNPRWLPTNMDAAYIDGFDIGAAEFFELCGQLGITSCSLNATFADGIYPADEVVEHYAATCDRAARYGVTCDLENLPMSHVGSQDAPPGVVDRRCLGPGERRDRLRHPALRAQRIDPGHAQGDPG
jgi:sugar phosphate isomerase/epimerase